MDIFAAKMWVAFAMQKLLTFLRQKNMNIFAIFQDRNFTVTLANNIVKFLTAGPRLSTFSFSCEPMICSFNISGTINATMYLEGTHIRVKLGRSINKKSIYSWEDLERQRKCWRMFCFRNIFPHRFLQNGYCIYLKYWDTPPYHTCPKI